MFDAQAIQDLKWWEVAAGVLSVPVALLGVIYTLFLIRKTDFETRKLRLEVAEKEAALPSSLPPKPVTAGQSLVLSRKEKLFAILFFALNLGAVAVFGLKTSPLIGLEVLSVVIGVSSCLAMFGGFLFLRVLQLIARLMAVDMQVIGILSKAMVSVTRGRESASEE